MTSYSVTTGEQGEIIFWTDSEELKEEVMRYIQNCADAISWRNRVERIYKRKGNGLEKIYIKGGINHED